MAGAGAFPKTSTLDVIYQLDYNTIQSTIAGVLSTYYGQSMTSSQVASNPVINDAEWDNLRVDINKCYKHITGADSTINDAAEGNLIYAADANAYKTAADYCETNKATVHSTQLSSTVLTQSLTGPWNGSHTWTYTFTWASAADANNWFNLGGNFFVDLSGSNSLGTLKDEDWQNIILNAMPTFTYGNTQWDAGVSGNFSQYAYGSGLKYSENYALITITKVSDTQLTISFVLNDADVGDQTGTGPAVDEDINTDASASITYYGSIDAIVGPTVTASQTSTW